MKTFLTLGFIGGLACGLLLAIGHYQLRIKRLVEQSKVQQMLQDQAIKEAVSVATQKSKVANEKAITDYHSKITNKEKIEVDKSGCLTKNAYDVLEKEQQEALNNLQYISRNPEKVPANP